MPWVYEKYICIEGTNKTYEATQFTLTPFGLSLGDRARESHDGVLRSCICGCGVAPLKAEAALGSDDAAALGESRDLTKLAPDLLRTITLRD